MAKIRDTQPRVVADHALDMPMWMAYIISNTAAYADFNEFLTTGIQRCEAMVADAYIENDTRKTALILGKREALKELMHQVDMYQKEEVHAKRRTEEARSD